jgi:hypothetical protein
MTIEVTVVENAKPKRVRPSSLALAESCSLAPFLSTIYPESHDCTRKGSAVDKQVSIVLSCIAVGDMANLPTEEDLLPETGKILDWLEKSYPIERWEWHVQEKVTLLDPETGELLTAGTPDLMCLHRTEPRFVDIDWKSRGQRWAGHLKGPEENLQQLAYVTAAWLEYSARRKIEAAKIILAFWDDTGVYPEESGAITEDMLTPIVVRVRAVPPIDVTGPRPEASVGEHCDHCYQRMKCSAHLLPMAVATQAGLPAPFAEFTGEEMTVETVVKVLSWLEGAKRVLSEAKKIVELVEGNVDSFVTHNGPVTVEAMTYGPVLAKGKRAGATVKTLEAEGLTRLIRQGDDKVTCKWYKAPKNV